MRGSCIHIGVTVLFVASLAYLEYDFFIRDVVCKSIQMLTLISVYGLLCSLSGGFSVVQIDG